MREVFVFFASLAGAAVLTSLQVLIAPTSPFWKWSLCISSGVFAACALGLFIDIMIRIWKSRKARHSGGPHAPQKEVIIKLPSILASPGTEETPKSTFRPRISRRYISMVSDAHKLVELSRKNDVLILYMLITPNAIVQTYVNELVSLLKSCINNPLPDLDTLGELRDLLVLLKGNDIAVYADSHWKFLPERWEEPAIRDPLDMENQLILAIAKPEWGYEDSVEVEVDNGQPRTFPADPIF